MAKPKLAFYWAASCGGCEITVTELGMRLVQAGDLVDIVIEADDLGGQQSLLMSPRTYHQVIQPRHKRLFSFIKEQAPVKVFYHTCGAVRRLIPDLIDAGIDILNPVQISAAGMDLRELKQEFGRDLVF